MSAVRSLFDPEVATLEGDPSFLEGRLDLKEEACVAGARPKRRLEFRAGRLLAREALARLGVPGHPLVTGRDRAPEWPLGVIGSISHAEGWCGAAVARKGRIVALGLDLETLGSISPEIDVCLTSVEKEWLRTRPGAQRDDWRALLFSAKESVYKCQHPVTRLWLDYGEVMIEVDPARGEFRARFPRWLEPLLPQDARFEGRFRFHDRWVGTGASFVRT